MKTAIQELIERLKIQANSISDNDHIEDRCWRNGIRLSLNIAKDLLEKEKEQICNAYTDGLEGPYIGAENYYNQTYNQNK
jgi:hypothetical protein